MDLIPVPDPADPRPSKMATVIAEIFSLHRRVVEEVRRGIHSSEG